MKDRAGQRPKGGPAVTSSCLVSHRPKRTPSPFGASFRNASALGVATVSMAVAGVLATQPREFVPVDVQAFSVTFTATLPDARTARQAAATRVSRCGVRSALGDASVTESEAVDLSAPARSRALGRVGQPAIRTNVWGTSTHPSAVSHLKSEIENAIRFTRG